MQHLSFLLKKCLLCHNFRLIIPQMNRTLFLLSGLILLISVLCGCNNHNGKKTAGSKTDSTGSHKVSSKELFKNVTFKPILGKRLSIVGDFNGDRKPDTLKEEYISLVTNQETFKDYQEMNFRDKLTDDECMMLTDTLMALIAAQKPLVRLKPTNGDLPVLTMPYYCNLTGIAYLINLGNINHQAGDELAIVTSSIRFAGATDVCQIYSCLKKGWTEVFSFAFRDDTYEESDIKTKIPGYLEKKNGKWYYQDLYRELNESDSTGESSRMVRLILK